MTHRAAVENAWKAATRAAEAVMPDVVDALTGLAQAWITIATQLEYAPPVECPRPAAHTLDEHEGPTVVDPTHGLSWPLDEPTSALSVVEPMAFGYRLNSGARPTVTQLRVAQEYLAASDPTVDDPAALVAHQIVELCELPARASMCNCGDYSWEHPLGARCPS